jgi:hypothetical protein
MVLTRARRLLEVLRRLTAQRGSECSAGCDSSAVGAGVRIPSRSREHCGRKTIADRSAGVVPPCPGVCLIGDASVEWVWPRRVPSSRPTTRTLPNLTCALLDHLRVPRREDAPGFSLIDPSPRAFPQSPSRACGLGPDVIRDGWGRNTARAWGCGCCAHSAALATGHWRGARTGKSPPVVPAPSPAGGSFPFPAWCPAVRRSSRGWGLSDIPRALRAGVKRRKVERTPLHDAAERGDATKVREIAAHDPEWVNAKDEGGRRPHIFGPGRSCPEAPPCVDSVGPRMRGAAHHARYAHMQRGLAIRPGSEDVDVSADRMSGSVRAQLGSNRMGFLDLRRESRRQMPNDGGCPVRPARRGSEEWSWASAASGGSETAKPAACGRPTEWRKVGAKRS